MIVYIYHINGELPHFFSGTYKVRNEIETKRNQQKRNEIENGRKNNRGLKEIIPIFTITMLDYFPHMSVFHQERTGFDHH